MAKASDNILDRWEAEQPEETRQAAIDRYVSEGTADLQAAGMSENEARMVVTAFSNHVENTVAKPLGLSLDVWNSYIDEADLPAFRNAVVKGDWELLRGHARKVAAHIAQYGDTNAE